MDFERPHDFERWLFFCNFAKMKKSAIFGITVLFIIWAALAYLLISTGGFNLKNLLLLVMTAIIIFVPMWKKYGHKD